MSIFAPDQKCSKLMTAEQLAADARSVRIEDEVTRRGLRLQGRGTDRAGPCPVCGGTDRFGVNIKKQMFYCRKCDVGGDVITFVRHVDGCTFKEAVNLLTGGHTPPQKPAPVPDMAPRAIRDSGGPAKAADNAARPPGYGDFVSRFPKTARPACTSGARAVITVRSRRRSAISPRTASTRPP